MSTKRKAETPPILAFSEIQVARLTGLTQRQLRYREERGVFRASWVGDEPGRPYRRIYSFRDLVGLKTLALLRRAHRVPLDELKKVGEYLARYVEAPWSEIQFRVAPGKRVVFRDPVSGEWISSGPVGQRVFITIPFNDIRLEVKTLSEQLHERDQADIGRVTRHRHIVHNSWVIAGTRVPTSAIWSFHEAGYVTEEILREYPHLTSEDVVAAIAHEQLSRAA